MKNIKDFAKNWLGLAWIDKAAMVDHSDDFVVVWGRVVYFIDREYTLGI